MERKTLLLWALMLVLGVSGQQIPITDKSLLSVLFDRSREPLVNAIDNIHFNVPPQFLPNTYRNVTLTSRFGDAKQVNIPENVTIPDLSFPLLLGQDEPFSQFIPMHRKMAARLINVFMEAQTYEDFFATALYARSLLNPLLMIYALSVAILHRNDTHNLPLPNFASTNPGRFIGGQSIARQIWERSTAPLTVEQKAQKPIEIPRDFTGTDLDIEHRLAYFREDVAINLHHWNWHLIYPNDGGRDVVLKDRRGELFYYTHQQILARYDFERLSNKLKLVKRFLNWREPIEEAYFPKLDSQLASRVWPHRQAYARLTDLARPNEELFIDIQNMERWRERILYAIHDGRVQNEKGSFVPLTERHGIDILGNIVEATSLSINRNIYGNLHNTGHMMLAFIHDPDCRYMEKFGVMGDSATAMRDPIFYRWHAFVNGLFQEHKKILPRYSTNQLGFPGISINSVEIQTSGMQKPNILQTFWQKKVLDLSRGLDFMPQGPVFVEITHLQHTAFHYVIKVHNSGPQRMGTMRIFMAPHFDERGIQMSLKQQTNLFIEMDRFIVDLKKGENKFVRTSEQSSVTLPYERTFRNQDKDRPPEGSTAENQFCGCGWPNHMLIPKGTAEGLEGDLFVMVSYYADDQVNQQSTNVCRDASSYCGIRGEKYPDQRAMGFPFDRPPPNSNETLASFKQLGNGNMFSIGVKIFHSNI